jgi:hypothetical protein
MSADPNYSKYLVPTRAPSSSSKPDYAQYAREEVEKLKIPEGIALRLFGLESGWNPKARSYKGAKGIGQMMPDTDRYIRGKYKIDTSTPQGQIKGSLLYLKEQYDEFGNDELAVAAYHAGPANVRKARGRIPNTSDGLTRTPNYVKKIVGTNELAPHRAPSNSYNKYLVKPKTPESELNSYKKYLVNAQPESAAPSSTPEKSNVLPFTPTRTPSSPATVTTVSAEPSIETKIDPQMSAEAKRAATQSSAPMKAPTSDELAEQRKRLKLDTTIANMPSSGAAAKERYQKSLADFNANVDAYNNGLKQSVTDGNQSKIAHHEETIAGPPDNPTQFTPYRPTATEQDMGTELSTVPIRAGGLLENGKFTPEALSDRVLEAYGYTPLEAQVLKEELAAQGKGLPYKVGNGDAGLQNQYQFMLDQVAQNGTPVVYVDPQSARFYRRFLERLRSRPQLHDDPTARISEDVYAPPDRPVPDDIGEYLTEAVENAQVGFTQIGSSLLRAPSALKGMGEGFASMGGRLIGDPVRGIGHAIQNWNELDGYKQQDNDWSAKLQRWGTDAPNLAVAALQLTRKPFGGDGITDVLDTAGRILENESRQAVPDRSNLPFLQRTMLQGGPQAAGNAAAFMAGGELAGAAKLPAWLASVGIGSITEAEQLYNQAIAEGKDKEAAALAGFFGLGIGATEGLGGNKSFEEALALGAPSLKVWLKEKGIDTGKEFLQETGQTFLEGVDEQAFIDPNKGPNLREIGDAGAASLFTSAVTGLGGGASYAGDRIERKIAERRATVAEKPQTIAEQLNALERGQRQAVLITKGESLPAIPSGYFTTKTKEGTFIHKRELKSKDVRRMVQEGTFGELLGHVAPKPVDGAPEATVAARDEQGNELQTSVVSPELAPLQAQALNDQFPNANIEVGGEETAQNVVEQRENQAVIQRQQNAMRRLAEATGDDFIIASTQDGTFAGNGHLNVDENDNVILVRHALNEREVTKQGSTMTREELREYGISGGSASATGSNSVNTSALENWNTQTWGIGQGATGTFTIPMADMEQLLRDGDAVFANLSLGEISLLPQVAERYLTHIDGQLVGESSSANETTAASAKSAAQPVQATESGQENKSESFSLPTDDSVQSSQYFSDYKVGEKVSNPSLAGGKELEIVGVSNNGRNLDLRRADGKGRTLQLQVDSPAGKGLKRVESAKTQIDVAAHESAASPENDLREPTQAQKDAGNFQMGHVKIGGLDVSIEFPAGAKRKPEHQPLTSHYGYIRRAEGADGEHLDVYIKPGTSEDYAGPVYVVDQTNKEGKFDEQKVLVGFTDEQSARAGYLANYPDGWNGLKAIRKFDDVQAFRDWLKTADMSKPASLKISNAPRKSLDDTNLYDRVREFVDAGNQVTPSSLQRKFGTGYGENQRVIDRLKEEGLIDSKGYKPIESSKSDESDDEFLQRLKNRVDGNGTKTESTTVKPKAKSSQIEKPVDSSVDTDDEFMRQLKERVANKQKAKVEEKRETIKRNIVEADDEISALLGQLKAAGKKHHGGPASDEELLLMVKLVRAYVKKGIHSFHLAALNFQEHFAEYGDPRRYDDYLQEAWAMLRESNPVLDEARSVGDILSEEEVQGDTDFDFGDNIEDVTAEQAEQVSDPQRQNKSAIGDFAPMISEDIARRLLSGEKFNIVAARKIASEIMINDVDPGTQLAKDVDEAIEAGVVQAAREIVAEGLDEKATYEKLVDLYKRQPNLNVRTSTSVAQQAYSTPVPIAYLASRLANINAATVVYEPTAGNAALLIGANPDNVFANELNPNRARVLREQLPGAQVTEEDASVFVPDSDVDSVIANPPFGVIKNPDGSSKKFKINSRYTTTEIDHAIALKALSAMKDDGNGVLILGGVQAVDAKARSDAYNAKAKRAFYYTLYQEYNVVDHLTIDGDLYSRQGAAFPIDVIVIQGRSESSRKLPAVDVPRIYDSYESLGELLNAPYRNSVLDATSERDSSQSKPTGDANSRSGRSRKRANDGQSNLLLFDFGQNSVSDRESGGSGIDAGQSIPGSERSKPVQPVNAGTERSGKQSGDEQLPASRTTIRDGIAQQSAQNSANQQSTGGKDVQANGHGAVDKRAPRTSSRVDVKEGQSQIAYEPASKANSLNTLVPVNMVSSTQNALNRISNKVGDIDSFVAEKLGYKPEDIPDYFSAEQVDALALALDNMERGKGFIIGDQTGIGKGRVVAGVIRYAIRTGRTPIFVTEKPNLYKDIYRDLVDIGLKDVRPLMTNTNERVPLDDEGRKVLRSSEGHNKELERLINLGTLDKYDVVFTTYSQLQTVQGKSTPRQDFIKAFANGGIIIFDESHNAGGAEVVQRGKTEGEKQGRALLARQIAATADGVFYSSATYAKRPQVMDLYFKTDMSLAVPIRQLAETIQKGGVPLQQVVASMLSEAGQYVRRERSFEGVEYATKHAPVNKQLAESVSKVMRLIQEFDDLKQAAVEAKKEEVKEEAKATLQDSSVGKAGVTSTNFTSLMHNLIDQMLLSLKMDATIDAAIESLKNGEKPVITVANTMGSFIASYAEENGLKPGDAMGLSFGDMLRRYLERSREILIGDAFGAKTRHYLTDAELGEYGIGAYKRAVNTIAKIDWSKMPASPIDYVKHKLEQAGFRVGEITGRQHTLFYSTSKAPVYRMRPGSEISIAGRNRTIQQFNNGQIDALILNQAGSTGLSLHASSKFRDRRQRHMIIAQAERNIDTHMQMLGRVHRTGQVIVPRYSQLVADVPAEMRPASVLAKKMASLNANTTASRGSALTAKDVPDFMNEYGDEIAAQLLEDDPDLYHMLGRPIKFAERGLEREDAMRKVTGRIPLLSIAEQERVYDLLTSEYDSFLQRLESTGENALEAKTLPLDAKPISKKEISPSKGTDSPFSAGAYLETMDVKKLGRPFSGEEVVNQVAANLESQSTDLDVLRREGQKKYFDLENATRKRFNEYKASLLDDVEDAAKRRAQETRLDGIFERWREVLGQATVGETVKLQTLAGEVYGVVTGVEQKGTPKNPVAMGSWRVNIAVADASRRISVPISQLLTLEQAHNGSNIGRSIVMETVSEVNDLINGRMPVLELFDLGQAETREKRNIITGNLLAGFGQFPKGAIINFTDSTGEVKQGILMPRSFDLEKEMADRPVQFETVKQVMSFLNEATGKQGIITSEDEVLRIQIDRNGDYFITTPASKAQGGRYFLNRALLDAAGQDFVKAGNTMRVMLDQAQAEKFIKELLEQEIPLVASTFKNEAKQVMTTLKGQITAEMSPSEEKEKEHNNRVFASMKATLRTKGKEARLYVNNTTADILSAIFRIKEGNSLGGGNIKKEHAKAAADVLTDLAVTSGDEAAENALLAVADALEDAANLRSDVVFINTELGGPQRIITTIRHEEGHFVQKKLQSIKSGPLDTSKVESHPKYESVKAILLKLGYPDDTAHLVNEVAVRIIGNQLDSIKLSKESAYELLDLYFDMVENAYGDEAVKEFKHIAPSFKRSRDERSRKSNQSTTTLFGNAGHNKEISGQDTERRTPGEELRETGDSSREGQGGVSEGVLQNKRVDEEPPSLDIRSKLRQAIDQAYKEEKRKNEAGFFRIRSENNQRPANPYAFENEERESRFQDAKKGIQKESRIEQFKAWLTEFARTASRDLEHLPRGAEYAELSNALRRLAKGKAIASDEAIRYIQAVTVGLSEEQSDLFVKKVILDDLVEEASRQEAREVEGIKLPFGFTPEELVNEYARISGFVDADEKVKAAVESRLELMKTITQEYYAASEAIGIKPDLSREHYYHHQVLEYAQAEHSKLKGTGGKLRAPTGRDFLRQRQGSELDINANYIQAEHHVIAQMLFDTEILKVFKLIQDNHDITPQLKRDAKAANEAALQLIIQAEQRNLKPAERKKKAQTLWQFIRSKGGIKLTEDTIESGELRRLSRKELGTTGLVSPNAKLTADYMREAAAEAGFIDRDMSLADFLSFVEDSGRDAIAMENKDAAADIDVEAMLEEDMPEDELRAKRKAEAFDKLVARHGLTEATLIRFRQRKGWAFSQLRQLANNGALWEGDNGEWKKAVNNLISHRNYGAPMSEDGQMFKYLSALAQSNAEGSMYARTIMKAVAQQRQFIQQRLGKEYKTYEDLIPETHRMLPPREGNVFYKAFTLSEQQVNAAITHALDTLEVPTEKIKEIMAWGGKRKGPIVPVEVADQIDNFLTPKVHGKFSSGMRKAVGVWKIWQLISPTRVFKYNARNVSGDLDAVIAGNPSTLKKLKPAAAEVTDFLFRKKAASENLEKWMQLGGLQGLYSVAEDPTAINGLGVFRNLSPDKEGRLQKLNLWRQYWRAARMGSDAREALLRYATFLDYLEQINISGRPKNYGASIRSEIDAMLKGKHSTNEEVAYKLSNDLLGAYDEVSLLGQDIRETFAPFWSWQEVNFKRYKRMFQNAVQDDQLASTVGRKIASMAVRSPVIAMRIGRFGLKAMALAGMLSAFNHLFFDDEEEDLPPDVRKRPHIILGRNSDGSVRYFSRLGAVSDLFEWFGIDGDLQFARDYLNGRKTLGDIATEMGLAVPTKLWNSQGPSKTVLEEVVGYGTYPNPLNPRKIRDRWEYGYDSIGLGDVYRQVVGMPTRGTGHTIANLFIYQSDSGEVAYNNIQSAARAWREKNGLESQGSGATTAKSNAAYYFKQALKYGDKRAADKYLREYILNGGTGKGLKAVLENLNPLASIPEKLRPAFIARLTADERKDLNQAIQFYYRILAPDAPPTQPGQAQEQNEQPAPVKRQSTNLQPARPMPKGLPANASHIRRVPSQM